MTKEPIQNESFLGVVLKPVIKDTREQAAPQQAIQLTKVTALKTSLRTMLFFNVSILWTTIFSSCRNLSVTLSIFG